MAPALSEACSIRRQPDIGPRESVKHLVAAATLPTSPSTLDPCFEAPAPGDTPPRHCLSPLSPPLSPPATDLDPPRRFLLDFPTKKGVGAAAVALVDQTCDNTMDLDCHLPDSPSSQLSVIQCQPAGAVGGLPALDGVDFTMPITTPTTGTSIEFDWAPVPNPADSASTLAAQSLAAVSRQTILALRYRQMLDRARRFTNTCLCLNAFQVAKRIAVMTKPVKRMLKDASDDALRTAVMKSLEEKYGMHEAAKRYLNRLQSVTFIKEKPPAKRKPCKAVLEVFYDCGGGGYAKRARVEEQPPGRVIKGEQLTELTSVFERMGAQRRCVLQQAASWHRGDVESGFEDDERELDAGEVTESSSGGESCDEIDGLGSRVRGYGPREERQGGKPSIERRALSQWMVDSHSLGARWHWLQINSDNLLTASHSLESQRRSLRMKKGCVLEGDFSNFHVPGRDAGEGHGGYRKNGYVMAEQQPEPGLGAVSPVLPCGLEDLAGIPSPAASEEGRRPLDTASRCLPLAKTFRRRRVVRVPERRWTACDAPRSLAELEQPVLAASKIHPAIHSVLSSMKDVPLSTHLNSLLLELSRNEPSAEELALEASRARVGGEPAADELDSERCASRGSGRSTAASRSKPGSPKATSARYKDKYRDKARRKSKWEHRDSRKSSRADSAASSPARNGSSSRGKNRIRTESNSSDQRRHKGRLSSKSQPGSSREPSPYEASKPAASSRRDRGSTSSTAGHRRSRGDQSFDIDSIVIPSYSMCAPKPTKVEYKEIPTPRWRPITSASQFRQMGSIDPAWSKRVMLDELFAVLHIDSEAKEKDRLMGTTGAVAQNRSRPRKNTVNASSGAITPARAMSPMSMDQGSEPSGAFSPSLSSPPPTPMSMDAIAASAAEAKDLYNSSKSSHRGKAIGSRTASKDDHAACSESSSYYKWRNFPMSEVEFAAMLRLEAEDGGEPGKRGSSLRPTKSLIKWDDTGPNLSESSEDSDDEMSEDETWDVHVKQKRVPGRCSGPEPTSATTTTSTTPASSNTTTSRIPTFNS